MNRNVQKPLLFVNKMPHLSLSLWENYKSKVLSKKALIIGGTDNNKLGKDNRFLKLIRNPPKI